jgi:hypothetical protein
MPDSLSGKSEMSIPMNAFIPDQSSDFPLCVVRQMQSAHGRNQGQTAETQSFRLRKRKWCSPQKGCTISLSLKSLSKARKIGAVDLSCFSPVLIIRQLQKGAYYTSMPTSTFCLTSCGS